MTSILGHPRRPERGSARWLLGLPAIGLILGVSTLVISTNKLAILFVLAVLGVSAIPVFLYFGVGLIKPILFLWALAIPTYARVTLGESLQHPGGTEVVPMISLQLLLGLPLVLTALARPQRSSGPRITWFAAALYLAVCCISAMDAFNIEASVYEILRLVQGIAFAWGLAQLAIDKSNRDTLLQGLAVGVLLQAALGVAQFLVGGPIGLTSFGEPATNFRGLEGYASGSAGTLGHPGPYALFMLMSAPLVLCSATTSEGGRKVLGYAAFMGTIVATLLSASRTAMGLLAMAVLPVAVFVYRSGSVRKSERILFWSAVSVGTISLAIAFWDDIILRFTTHLTASLDSRFLMNDIAISLFQKEWLLGYGPNNYIDVVWRHMPLLSGAWELENPVHQVYLLILVETGVAGLVAFLLLVATVVWNVLKTTGIRREEVATGYAILGSMTALLLYHFTGWGGIQHSAHFFFWTLVGLGVAFSSRVAGRSSDPSILGAGGKG